jgi:hypothetical protein
MAITNKCRSGGEGEIGRDRLNLTTAPRERQSVVIMQPLLIEIIQDIDQLMEMSRYCACLVHQMTQVAEEPLSHPRKDFTL